MKRVNLKVIGIEVYVINRKNAVTERVFNTEIPHNLDKIMATLNEVESKWNEFYNVEEVTFLIKK
jgi:archaellum component FlaC